MLLEIALRFSEIRVMGKEVQEPDKERAKEGRSFFCSERIRMQERDTEE